MEALVQLRGEVNQSGAVKDTLDMLNLGRVNHCTFVPETDAYRGMITKVNDWVAHGEPSAASVATVLERRGQPIDGDADDGQGVTDAWVAEHTPYDDVAALAAALVEETITLREAGLRPTLRLHPPRGGHDGIKQPPNRGGQLGRHSTAEIDALLTSMR